MIDEQAVGAQLDPECRYFSRCEYAVLEQGGRPVEARGPRASKIEVRGPRERTYEASPESWRRTTVVGK
jgi:hypothetical protein